MSFRIRGLDPAPFRSFYGAPDDVLARAGVRRLMVDASPGFPDRVEVRDLEPGEAVLLLNHVHQPADNPYRASHAIFVREGAERACDVVNAVPEALRIRTLSVRSFDDGGEMVDADLVDGRSLPPLIARLLAEPRVAYLHAHYAKRGCYAARIERA